MTRLPSARTAEDDQNEDTETIGMYTPAIVGEITQHSMLFSPRFDSRRRSDLRCSWFSCGHCELETPTS